MSDNLDEATKIKAEVDQLLADQGQRIKDAVTAALAADDADDAQVKTVLDAIDAELQPPPAPTT